MMLNWLFTSPSERRLLGARPLQGPTPWVIAIMTFAIMIIAAAGLALAETAHRVSEGAAARYSVQVPGGQRTLPQVMRAIGSAPGVSNATAVPEREMRKTLERWLGPTGAAADLPVPALVTFDVGPGTELEALDRRVRTIAPGARVIAHREALGPVLRSLYALQWIALALAFLLGGACAAAVVLAARGALDTHRFTIDVMHGIGATDVQVTRLFQRKIAIDALIGSILGGAAAAVILIVLAAGATFAGDLMGGTTLGLVDILVLALIPLALTALATLVARAAVLSTLRSAL
jgi:cell division transport system permease protein